MKVTWVESFSTVEVAALYALTYLCETHQLEVGDNIVLTAKFGICWGRPVWPVGPTGQTDQLCTVRVELDFL